MNKHQTPICAHAAGSDFGPPNSVRAAEISLAHLENDDLIEVDVQETADGELVLVHGGIIDSLRFAVGKAGLVRGLELRDLRDFNPELATLEEMLRAINSRCGIVLDVKDSKIELGKLREVVEANHTGITYLTDANHKLLTAAANENLEWPRVAQCRMATQRQIEYAIQVCNPQIIDVWPLFLNELTIRNIQNRGLNFVPGGMMAPFSKFGEDPDRLRSWANAGATYLITFNPEKTKKELAAQT